MYKRLLVPVDGSGVSLRGLDEAVSIIKATGANYVCCMSSMVSPLPSSTTSSPRQTSRNRETSLYSG